MDFDWEQIGVVHCPDNKCKGLLLQSDFCHEEKCSDCKKYWIGIFKYFKRKEPIIQLQNKFLQGATK